MRPHRAGVAVGAYAWAGRLRQLYEKALAQFRAGNRDAGRFFKADELAFLATIGARPSELFDFAEDAGELDWETALLICAVRRDYFLAEQRGEPAATRLSADAFPAKNARLGGIAWLPRLILKTKARLRGELPDELMYCCGGDRKFFKDHDIHPADFLRAVWAAREDDAQMLDYVKGKR
jgi:hypothetical protein